VLKESATQRDQLLAQLGVIDDARGKALHAAINAKDWGLDAAEEIVAGESESPARAEIDTLRRLAQLPAPEAAAVAAASVELLDADARAKKAAGTLAARAKDLAEILDHALRFHEAHGDGDCPVCGRAAALNQGWRTGTLDQVKGLRETAQEATAAQAGVEAALRRTGQLRGPSVEALVKVALPDALQALSEALARAREEAERWLAVFEETDLEALAGRLDAARRSLAEAVDALRTLAEAELRKREDAWRPVADRVRLWLATAREARKASEPVKALKAAEGWLKQAAEDLRNERFAPIKEKAQAIWNQLRMQSNVSLEDIRLAGTATRRQVELDVTVDGVAGAALGVMSQGELHALALSLFIPRATLPESPFRFVVIDDPVQSMDPARVDGLARVLQGVARERQVIVFTHDDRLPEAVRRLDVAATIIEVTRRGNSVVEPKPAQDPVSRYITDAIALAASHDGMPAQAVRRVVPVICRSAIEAACAEAVRRRRLAAGQPHAEVEALIDGLKGTRQFAALALFDDPEKTAEVMARLNAVRHQHADVFRAVNEGAHEIQPVAIFDLVKDAERLARYIQGLK
jgi:predicted ATPase